MDTTYKLKTKLRDSILPAYLEGKIELATAISHLDISERQFYRLLAKHRKGNLEHGLCNKPSNHRIDELNKSKLIDLYKTDYKGWNYEHIHDELLRRNGINISSDSIRNILFEAIIISLYLLININ